MNGLSFPVSATGWRPAGVDKPRTFHGLRHVATTFMVEEREQPRVIQHRLGHATARLSTELYAHVPDRADREVAGRLQERFGPVVERLRVWDQRAA